MQIPINTGSVPNWNTQIDNPELFNLFVTKDGNITYTPGLDLKTALANCRAVWETPFDNDSYIVVTNSAIYRIKPNGTKKELYQIINSTLAVDITENLRSQVTVTDGKTAYVIDQENNDKVTILSEAQGFDLKNPGSCTMVNSFTLILDIVTGIWDISDPNNALVYGTFGPQAIDPNLATPLAVRSINNNLFIFGTGGIERWEPTLNTNTYLYPLTKDMNFEIDFGAISTSCIVANISTIYFLSSRYIPMQYTAQGFKAIVPAGDVDGAGIAKEISQYPDVTRAMGAFYSFRGNLFYQLTFLESAKTWLYSINSNTFSNTDDFIIGGARINEFVITPDGFYELSLTPDDKHRYWIGGDTQIYKGNENYRNQVTGAEVRMTQGSEQLERPEYLSLAVSVDRRTWSNYVRLRMGMVGEFNYRTLWQMCIACQYFKPRVDYYGTYPLTIEAFEININ